MNNKPATPIIAPGRWVLIGLLSLLLAAGLVTRVAHADTNYTVQSGDSLTSIAARYNTTIDAIVTANSLPSRTIYVGQVLRIPSSSPSSAPANQPIPASGQYTVQPGDTLSDIALRFGTTTDALMRANNLTSTTIYTGQVLRIVAPNAAPPSQPTNPAPQANPDTYTVQSGDNLITLAARFGVTREALAAANGISPSSLLYIGQVLRIPKPGEQPKPPPAPTSTPKPPATDTPQPPTSTAKPPAAVPTTTPQPVAAPANATPGKPVQYTVQAGDNLSSIAAKFNTTVPALLELNNLDDGNLLYVGQVLTIVKGNDQSNAPPSKTAAPQPSVPMGKHGPKWVDVNISAQLMTAYEGQVPVYSSRMSSGTYKHPTVEGTYRVYAKYRSTKMEGGQGTPDYYYIPNVPYTLYFYSGYALHGAFWHNNFGQPMSHGCVNLPVDVAKWIYEWAPIGTMVVSHK